MHDPIGFSAFGGFANVENECFLDANFSAFGGDDLVGSGSFPVPGPGYPVGSGTIRVLPVPRAKKVPLFLTENRLAYSIHNKTND